MDGVPMPLEQADATFISARRTSRPLGPEGSFPMMLKQAVRLQMLKDRAVNRKDEGASAVEYGLLVALIAAVIIVAVILLGGNLSSIFNRTASSIGS
jgi:pilus assembly protein Flp/PilA